MTNTRILGVTGLFTVIIHLQQIAAQIHGDSGKSIIDEWVRHHVERVVFNLVDRNGVPTTNGSGLLIASKMGSDSRGTVCDDGWNTKVANLVCESMGYTCHEYWVAGIISESQTTMSTLVDDVECPESSTSFQDCTYSTNHNCQHSEDVILMCGHMCDYVFKLVDENGDLAKGDSGLLIANKVGTDKNGTVCDDSFNVNAATLICQSMGHTCASNWDTLSDQVPIQSQLDIILDDVECSEPTGNFADVCSFRTLHNCGHSEDIYLSCGCITDQYNFRLLDKEGEISSDGTGILIAEETGENGKSGTVCDDNFSEASADLLCKDFGYSCVLWWENGDDQDDTWTKTQSDLKIIITNLMCQPSSSGLDGCSFSSDTSSCHHAEDVFLFCGSEAACNSNQMTFYLVDDNNKISTDSGSGLLIASRSSIDGAVGTVCDDNFSGKTAELICQQLGFKCSTAWHAGNEWEMVQNEYDVMLDDVLCGPDNQTFAECSWMMQNNCGHSEDVFLSCAEDCTYTFSLLNEIGVVSDTGSGLLIATRASGEDGTVCDDNFGENSAAVICKEMGFACSVYWSPMAWDIATNMSIMLDNVKCSSSEMSFVECDFNSGNHNCIHNEDIHLNCANTCTEKEIVSFKLVDGKNKDITSNGQGLLVATRNISETLQLEGTVCDDDFTPIISDILCRELGFSCSRSHSSGLLFPEIQSSYNIIMDTLACAAGEDTTFEKNCTFDTMHNCGHSEDVFLVCGEDCSEEITRHVEFRLLNEEGETSSNGTGLLVVKTVQMEGTVCDDKFTDMAAAAICKEMGYTCAGSWKVGVLLGETFGLPIAMDNVECRGNTWPECDFELSHNCGHDEDIVLSCSDLCLRGHTLKIELVDNAGDISQTDGGLVIVTTVNDDISGTVCSNHFTLEDGAVFCKSLGYSCALKVSSAQMEGTTPWPLQDTYPIAITDVRCKEGTNNVNECDYSLTHDCTHLLDLYLTCGGERNIARVGVATQSGNFYEAYAWLAIDGNTNGDYFSGSVSHTLSVGDEAWWKLSWNQPMDIDIIRLYNRADCCQERLIGATVIINGTELATISSYFGEDVFTLPGIGMIADEIEIRGSSENSYLSLAEVEVFGVPSEKDTCPLTFKLLNEDGTLSKSGTGLLVVNKQGYSDDSAGTVCDDFFNQQSASVICKSMGYLCAISWATGDRWVMQNDHQVLLDDVSCRSSDVSFSECSYQTSGTNCGHTEDIFLTCDSGLEFLGCWKNVEGIAIPTLEGSNPYTEEHWMNRDDPIGICLQIAHGRGWSVFAVQRSGMCASSATAEDSYRKYGPAHDCGTSLLSQRVYKIADRDSETLGYDFLGCWKEGEDRAIPSLEFEGQHSMLDGMPYFREDPIGQCRLAALDNGYTVFGVDSNGFCHSSADAPDTFSKYGEAAGCITGDLEGSWINHVYRIESDSCSNATTGYKFHLVDEKGNKAEKYGLLIAEAKAGTGQEVPGTVCDDSFNETSAAVICKEMGFTCSLGWYKKQWEDIQGTFPIVLDDIECGNDNMTFNECSYKRMATNCAHSEDVFLKCDNECSAVSFTFSLKDANTGEDVTADGKGLLLAAENGTDSQGTVCDDSFTLHTATLLCQTMGFTCAREWFVSQPVSELQLTFDIILDNVECTVNTTTFGECSFVSGHNCGHSEDVFLTCKHTVTDCERKDTYTFYLADENLQETTATGAGLLVARRMEDASEGTVCDDKFNNTAADVICREVGFGCATTWFQGRFEKVANWSIILDNVECNEEAESFSDCSFRNHHDCSHNEDVHLFCQDECKGTPFSFFLIDSNGHQTTKGEGLLIVHTMKSGEGIPGGTVCGDGFNDVAAAVVCKQMGHDHAVSWKSEQLQGIQMIYPAMLNDVSCTSADLEFTSCSYNFNHTCTTDVYLRCERDAYTQFMCPPGSQYTDSTCKPCPSNTYKTLYDDSRCMPCEKDKYSGVGSASCVTCPSDATRKDESCVCPPGSVLDFVAGVCVVCPADMYHSPQSAECLSCPEDTESDPGSTECQCGAGKMWSDGECVECPTGFVSGKLSSDCFECPQGVPGSPDKASCECGTGYFWDIITCVACPAGQFSDSVGSLSCQPCPDYTFSTEGASSCSSCQEGQAWRDGACEACPSGYYGDRVTCISVESSKFVEAIKSVRLNSKSWVLPVVLLIILALVCVVLVVTLIRYRRKVVALQRIPYGMDLVEGDDEFVVMSYEPRMVESSADNVQLLPASD